MFDGRWRAPVERGLKPVGKGLQRTGVKADHLTATGLVLAGGCAVAIGSGHLAWGLGLLVASALPDVLDGAVAKASGTASPRGAFFDSVADRISDALVLGGIGWHLGATRGGQWPMLAMAVLALSLLISYERAKAEGLGYAARGGLMERAERIIAVAIGLAFPTLLVPVLFVMLALTGFTAVQRFVMVWRQASQPRPIPDPVESWWKAWRISATMRPRPRPLRGELTERWRARRELRPVGRTRRTRPRHRTRP